MSSMGPKRFDAFLSYNSQDRAAVEELERRLRREGLALYLEVRELAPGREFQPALAQALGDSKTCVMFLGPSGLGPWQAEELQVAIDKRVRDRDFHVIPVLLPGSERPRRGDVAHLEFLINASWVEFLKSLDDEKEFQRLVWGITGKKGAEAVEPRYEGVCPYRGLEPFGTGDARFFFGRENLTDWLVSDLRREIHAPQGVRLLAVLGPSGSGKSSVVLAGLIPRVNAGAIDGSEQWKTAVVRPGDDPLANLAVEVSAPFLPKGAVPDVGQARKLIEDLQGDERGLDLFARLALRDRAGRGAAARGGRPVRGGVHLPAAGRASEGPVREGACRFLRQPAARRGRVGGAGGGRPDDAVGLPGSLRVVHPAQRRAQRAPGAGRADAGGRATGGDQSPRVPGRLRSGAGAVGAAAGRCRRAAGGLAALAVRADGGLEEAGRPAADVAGVRSPGRGRRGAGAPGQRDLPEVQARGARVLPADLPAAGAAGRRDRGHEAPRSVSRALARRPGTGGGDAGGDPRPGPP